MGYFLPFENLPALKEYKYQSEDRSLTTKYVLKPFWDQFSKLFPLWMAPNVVTLLGLVFVIINVITVFYYDPYLISDQPTWCYFSYALGIFLYQTFDACDGLHARRTGQSGPLGELFDHCVDALNTTLSTIVFASVVGLGYTWVLILVQFSTLANFYLSTWEEYHTHKLFLSEFSGPVEGILMVVVLFIVTGIYGAGVWRYEFFNLNLSYFGLSADFKMTSVHFFLVFGALGLYFNIHSTVRNVSDYYQNSKKTNAAVRGIFPFFIYYSSVFAWLVYNPIIIAKYLAPFVLTVGLTIAFNVGRIIIGHLTQQSFPKGTPSSYIPIVQFLIFKILISIGYSEESVTGDLIWTGFGLSLGLYSLFIVEIIYEITTYLDLYTLSIKHPKKIQ
ncbi:hypothetical protein WICMUC_002192 [Wickerhamomyces mucosus]|uniref:diacylglycerol cholinephosphotransferase n=1 Tax=Wickerhamomyces mucosus TaxID=1378264 RepID=A0A9P8PRD9_9ASCO|nr:hypothetical protein WICMUC_002192 [Wickerhamomyces mucosus]